MSKLPKPKLSFLVPLYGIRIMAFIDSADASLWLINSNDEPLGVDSRGVSKIIHHTDGEMSILIGVFDNSRSTLIHELSHASFYILGRVGIEIRQNEPNESFCYLLEYLYKHCERILT